MSEACQREYANTNTEKLVMATLHVFCCGYERNFATE